MGMVLSLLCLDVRVLDLKLDLAERTGVVGASVALQSLVYCNLLTTNDNNVNNNKDNGGQRKELLRK